MQPNWTRQLILAILLVVLGYGAYYLEFKRKPRNEAAEEDSKKIFAIKETPVETLRLETPLGPVELTCADFAQKLCKPGDNSKWQLTAPMKTRADDSNANALLSALNNLQITESIDLTEETPEKRAALLEEYGLGPEARKGLATRKVRLHTGAGDTTVYFGSTHPVGERTFAVAETGGKLEDKKVYLVPSYFKTNFEHPLTYWRDKKLFSLATSDVQVFLLDGTHGNIAGEKKDGQWTLKHKGEELAGDIENIDNLLSGATYLTAKEFTADNKTAASAKAALGANKPVLTLALNKSKTESPVTLTLYAKMAKGKPEGKLFAAVSNLDPLFELELSAFDRLNKDLKDLRLTKLITSMDRFTAKRLAFEGGNLGGKPLVLVQKEGKWTVEGESTATDNDKVQGVLDKLSGNRIKDFLAASAAPKESGGLKVTLGDEKEAAKRQLLFWKGDAGKLYARDLSSKRPEVYQVDPVITAALPWAPGFFQSGAGTPAPTGGHK